MTRHCIICGARVRNRNPHVNTCQKLCTEAKHSQKSINQIVKEFSLDFSFEELKMRPTCDVENRQIEA